MPRVYCVGYCFLTPRVRWGAQSVSRAVQAAVDRFGGIDILVNNASAINLSDTETLDMKRYGALLCCN